MNRKTLFLSAVLIALLVALVVMLRPLLNDSSVWPPDDYVEYWAAGKLNLEGANPYSPAELLPLERFAGRDTDEAIMMWNPPWTLSLAMPLGALPAREGQFVWLLLQAGAVIFAAVLLWNCFLPTLSPQGGVWCAAPGGRASASENPSTPARSGPTLPPTGRGCKTNRPSPQTWIAVAMSLGFVPTMFLLQSGQISGFLVLGAALYIWGIQRGYDFLAGAAAVLLAVKPHLAYLLWLAIALDAFSHRRYRIILGGVVVGIAATAIPMLFNPQVWTQYFAAYRDHPPAQWVSLTLGSVLRLGFGEKKFWLQFVPVLLGLGWFALQWKKHWRTWNWVEQTPAILLVSFVTAPYGAWHFDLVLLLVPMLYRVAGFVAHAQFENATLGNHTGEPGVSATGAVRAGRDIESGIRHAVRLSPVADVPGSPVWLVESNPSRTTMRFYFLLFVVANLAMIALNRAGVYSYWFGWVAPLVLVFYIATAKRQPSSQFAPVPV